MSGWLVVVVVYVLVGVQLELYDFGCVDVRNQ